MAPKVYKRRTYILKNTSQSKYIFSYFILFSIGLLLFSFVFSFMSMETTTISYTNNEINIGNTPYVLLTKMLGSGWIIIVAGGFLLFLMSIVMTHRVAGPAYRIDLSLSKMLKGEFGFAIGLRKKDELKVIANKLELLSIKIDKRINKIKTHEMEMTSLINDLQIDEEIKKELIEKNKELSSFISFGKY